MSFFVLDRTHRRRPATSICPRCPTLSIAMRVGTRHHRCVMLLLRIAGRKNDTARSPLCPLHRHPIFVSVRRSGMIMQLILRCQRSKEKASRKRIRFLSIAACSKWASSLRCATICVAHIFSHHLQRAAQHVDRAVQSVGDKLRNGKATKRSIGGTYTFEP